MAAGLGFKDFTTGEVLTAADVDGYLMQGIWVFASAAARDSAVTSPQEGNACYLKDTNQVLTYSGSAWVAVGGGSPLTTKGDVYGFSTVDARIPIGANNTVLTADSTQALGLKWATPAAGGTNFTLLNSPSGTALTGSGTITVSGISGVNQLLLIVDGYSSASTSSTFGLRINADSGSTQYIYMGTNITKNATPSINEIKSTGASSIPIGTNPLAADLGYASIQIWGGNASGYKTVSVNACGSSDGIKGNTLQGLYLGSATISSVSLISSVGNFDAGTLYVYGG